MAKKCPVCGASVKIENIERHLRDQHPRAGVDVQSVLTEEEREETVRRKRAARSPAITKKGIRLIAVIAVVVGAILVLAILNPFGNVGPKIGQTAPDFSVRTTSGGTVTLNSLRGAVVLLEFMDPDCPACNAEVPTLVSLHANYTSVHFLSIDVNFVEPADNDAKLAAWAESHGATWTYALDATGGIHRMYGVDRTPTAFVLDGNGVVRAIVGPPSNTYGDFEAAFAAAAGA